MPGPDSSPSFPTQPPNGDDRPSTPGSPNEELLVAHRAVQKLIRVQEQNATGSTRRVLESLAGHSTEEQGELSRTKFAEAKELVDQTRNMDLISRIPYDGRIAGAVREGLRDPHTNITAAQNIYADLRGMQDAYGSPGRILADITPAEISRSELHAYVLALGEIELARRKGLTPDEQKIADEKEEAIRSIIEENFTEERNGERVYSFDRVHKSSGNVKQEPTLPTANAVVASASIDEVTVQSSTPTINVRSIEQERPELEHVSYSEMPISELMTTLSGKLKIKTFAQVQAGEHAAQPSDDDLQAARRIAQELASRDLTEAQRSHLRVYEGLIPGMRRSEDVAPRTTFGSHVPDEIAPPTQDVVLSEVLRLAAETNQNVLRNYARRLGERFTPSSLKDFEQAVSIARKDDYFRGDERAKFTELEAAMTQLQNPEQFLVTIDREIARALNPRAFERMNMVISNPDVGRTIQLDGVDFTVSKRLGGGAYAEGAYLATHEDGNEVVIKVADTKKDQRTRAQFDGEKYTLLRLEGYQRREGLLVDDEPLTPSFLGSGTTVGGNEFIIMTAAKGTPALEIQPDQLTEDDIVRMGDQYGRVLQALHGIGKSYHDLQPKNFFWDTDTQKGMVIDWNLLAPGFDPNGYPFPVDMKGDIYNVAKMLLRVAAPDISKEQIENGDLSNVDIDPQLKSVLSTAISRNPDERYETAEQFRAAFMTLL